MPDDQHANNGPRQNRVGAPITLPIYRGSTMLHVDTADRLHDGSRMYEQSDTYGVYGSATHHALEDLIVGIEGGTRCQITSSGLSACTTALLAYLKAGDHCLVPDSVYGSTRDITTRRSTLPAWRRCSAPTPRFSTSKVLVATRSKCRTSPLSLR